MSNDNKFGFGPLDTNDVQPRRQRSPGPMGVAVRDAAENLAESTEAKVQQRRQNAEDAREYRQAQEEGRVLVHIPLSEIATDDLPRDRMELHSVASSDEMEELKASIRARGQKEPIEIYVGHDGRYQLKKGWRRLTALTQLHGETGDAAFARVTARIEQGQGARIERYVDMVEENVVREDLTFAEMAQVAITASQDEGIDAPDANELVSRLYGALHKTKRSYIRNFVFLLSVLAEDLKWPKAVPRNLGVDVARRLSARDGAEALRAKLRLCESEAEQAAVLTAFLSEGEAPLTREASGEARQKFEFFVENSKVTARKGEVRIVSERDFASLPKGLLQEAVRAFEAVLDGGQGPQ